MKCPVCSDILVSNKEFCPECGKQISVVRFPSLWKRFFAILIDFVMVFVLYAIFLVSLGVINAILDMRVQDTWTNVHYNLVAALLWLIYTIIMNMSVFRGTVGKLVFGMIVIYNTPYRYNTSPIAYGASIVRQFMWVFYAGFPIVSLFWYGSFLTNQEHNAWHERSAGTIVVHKPSKKHGNGS